jgi:membrane protease YdiL (CAAX protease family)
VRALLRRLLAWRVGLGWFVVAILMTEAITLVASALTRGFGAPNGITPLPIDGIKIALFIAVVGEEIGWRGYALPRLMDRFRAVPASLILGALWAIWHLPTFFLPGTAQSHFPFPAYVLYTSSLSLLFTWFFFHTQGSVLFAWFLHGAVNTFVIWNTAADPALMHWMQAAVFALAAAAVVVFAGPPFKRR